MLHCRANQTVDSTDASLTPLLFIFHSCQDLVNRTHIILVGHLPATVSPGSKPLISIAPSLKVAQHINHLQAQTHPAKRLMGAVKVMALGHLAVLHTTRYHTSKHPTKKAQPNPSQKQHKLHSQSTHTPLYQLSTSLATHHIASCLSHLCHSRQPLNILHTRGQVVSGNFLVLTTHRTAINHQILSTTKSCNIYMELHTLLWSFGSPYRNSWQQGGTPLGACYASSL